MSAHLRTAIVIGGGIGGPAMALALQRAGIEPAIYEAHEGSAAHVGSFLNLASNGLDALRTLGAADPVLAAGFPTPRMVMWSGTGKRLGEVANGAQLPGGIGSLTIKRGLLHQALRDEAARRRIPIRAGKRFVHAELVADGVVARFADGSVATGDVLVGADGIHSRVREVIDPTSPAPRYTGQLSIGGIARGAGAPAAPGSYHMIFGKRAFFGYAVAPDGEIYWFANVAEPAEPARGAPMPPPAHWKRRVAELCAEDAGPACAIVDATEDEVAATPIHDLPRVPVWHRGPIALLGDAIHATSPSAGQGAALAIEDALVLARCLRDAPSTAEAFAAYERARRARVERVVRYANRVGSTKIAGPVGRFFRDLMMPLALRLFARSSSHTWLYHYHVDWEAPA